MMGWYGNGMGLGGWLAMGLVFFVLVGVIVSLALRQPWIGPGQKRRVDTPELILDRRFAAGEIDEPTYTQQRRALFAAQRSR